MGRWAHYDTDEERLPEGMTRIGYDADTQTYSYRDHRGKIYDGAPGNKYGVLTPRATAPRLPSVWITADDEADDEDVELPDVPDNFGLYPDKTDDSPVEPKSPREKSPRRKSWRKKSVKEKSTTKKSPSVESPSVNSTSEKSPSVTSPSAEKSPRQPHPVARKPVPHSSVHAVKPLPSLPGKAVSDSSSSDSELEKPAPSPSLSPSKDLKLAVPRVEEGELSPHEEQRRRRRRSRQRAEAEQRRSDPVGAVAGVFRRMSRRILDRPGEQKTEQAKGGVQRGRGTVNYGVRREESEEREQEIQRRNTLV